MCELLEYKNITQEQFFSLSKGQCKETIREFIIFKQQRVWDSYISARLMKNISPLVGVYPVWEEGSRKCTTVMAQLRTKHTFLNDAKGRIYRRRAFNLPRI